MTYCSDKHHRRSIRLSGYDYSQNGAYFVTVCTQNRDCLFGAVEDGNMVLNSHGQIVFDVWSHLPEHYFHVQLDQFVVMPNHFHGIIVLNRDNVGAGLKPAPTNEIVNQNQPGPAKIHALPEIIRGFKTFSSRQINDMRGAPGDRLWQRNYYEHVIRNESEWNRLRQYIVDNPVRWDIDRENPNAGNATAGQGNDGGW